MLREFVWDPDKLALGVKAMDDEHQQLIRLMNHLQKIYLDGAPAQEQGKAFAALADYTVRHFQDEEAYMEKMGYPDITVHKGVHRNLLKQVTAHAQSFKATGAFTDELFAFLNMWLRSHICGIDRKYADHVHQRHVASA